MSPLEPIFTLEFVQAVNDYQAGGDSQKKAERLAPLCSGLPQQFRSCSVICYRQEAHPPDRLWRLIAEQNLPMRYSSWTTSIDVAKSLKGGVPPRGLRGVILRLRPPEGSVLVNLDELYRDEGFRDAVNQYASEIVRRADGIDRYGNSQAEIILDLPTGTIGEIHCFGGFLQDVRGVAREALQREPTQEEVDEWARTLEQAKIRSGDQWWLSHEGSRAVWQRIQEKRRQEELGN
jgi:hypothetical protein